MNNADKLCSDTWYVSNLHFSIYTREESSSLTYPTLDSRNQQISPKNPAIHAISRFLRDNSMIRVENLENRVYNSYFSPQLLPRSHEIFRILLVRCLVPLLGSILQNNRTLSFLRFCA
jgi:hypothetical protein